MKASISKETTDGASAWGYGQIRLRLRFQLAAAENSLESDEQHAAEKVLISRRKSAY